MKVNAEKISVYGSDGGCFDHAVMENVDSAAFVIWYDGRIKKLMEWPGEGNIRRKRLLRRADNIESCINAVINE
jgi:hypothetical protein